MSTNATELTPCEDWQGMLDAEWQTCDRAERVLPHDISYTNYLMTPTVKGNIQQRMVFSDGKSRKIRLKFNQPIDHTEAGSSCTEDCAEGTFEGDCVEEYELTGQCTNIKRTFKVQDLRFSCTENMAYITSLLRRMINAADEAIEVKNIADTAALIGNYGANEVGTDVTNVIKTIVTRDADNKLDPEFLTNLEFAGVNAGVCATPVLFAWRQMWVDAMALKAGCCNDFGISLEKMLADHGHAVIKSRHIEENATFGTNGFMMQEPGAAQFVHFTEYTSQEDGNILHTDDDTFKTTVLISPNTGVPYDMLWHRTCPNTITIAIKVEHEVFGLPDNMYKPASHYAGTNGIYQGLISN